MELEGVRSAARFAHILRPVMTRAMNEDRKKLGMTIADSAQRTGLKMLLAPYRRENSNWDFRAAPLADRGRDD
jgi:hypothetical protein